MLFALSCFPFVQPLFNSPRELAVKINPVQRAGKNQRIGQGTGNSNMSFLGDVSPQLISGIDSVLFFSSSN